MPRRDRLRDIIDAAVECYDVAATPRVSPLYPPTPQDPDLIPIPEGRKAQLQVGIDCRGAVMGFLRQLCKDHGSKRAERLLEHVQGRYLHSYGRRHRQEIVADRRRLIFLIRANVKKNIQE